MKYSVEISQEAKDDILRLEKSGDKGSLRKLYKLLEELEQHPKSGTGKPEQLKHFRNQPGQEEYHKSID
ncbi:type II toxin-antitoxin system RelE/ParE family toxin [Cruoricaptor ignavus]|uniref:type II toxin-antitoxin system YoeB family toxin n=1 Tax=Cruoricaptor ignavus TaxID=1118202 RepID=UPI0021D3C7C6|nr:type II toxin-antitoxin system YoeB family toxin [Cruoricaptor ignavus]